MERKKVKQKSRRKLAISAALSGLLYLALEESIKKFSEYLITHKKRPTSAVQDALVRRSQRLLVDVYPYGSRVSWGISYIKQ